MTYKELIEKLQKLDTEQLKQEVTLFDLGQEEYFPIGALRIAKETDVLDKGHPFITF